MATKTILSKFASSRVSTADYEKLKLVSEREGVSTAALIRSLVLNYLNQNTQNPAA